MVFSKCISYRLPVATLFLTCFAVSGVAKRNNTGFRFLCQGIFYAIFVSLGILLICSRFYTRVSTKPGVKTWTKLRLLSYDDRVAGFQTGLGEGLAILPTVIN